MTHDERDSKPEAVLSEGETKDETKIDRREFVKRCGKYSLYVAPIVATLVESKGAKAQGFTVA